MPVYKKTTIELNNYQNLFEHSQDGIYFTTIEGEIIEVNQAFLDITGYKREEIEGINASELYLDKRKRIRFQSEIHKNQALRDFEVELVRKDGTPITCLLTSSTFKSNDEKTIGYKGLLKDITLLKVAESALKTSEKRFRELFHGSPDPIFVQSFDGIILDVNPAACDMVGMLYTELVGKAGHSLVPPELIEKTKENFEIFISGKVKMLEGSIYGKDQKAIIPVETSVNRIKYLDQPAILMHVRDITRRKEIESQLVEERRKGLIEITEGQEREKKRISRELHDGIGQMLFGTKMSLESLKKKVKGQENIYQQVKQIEDDLKEIISEVRLLSRQLRPSVLDDFGLVPAIKQLTEHISNTTGIIINHEFISVDGRIASQTETALYRIVQEALNNAMRHGKASEIWCCLEKKQNTTALLIRDNGIGFSIQENKKFGHGLINMKERAESLQGKFEISSVPERGTVVKIVVPNESFY